MAKRKSAKTVEILRHQDASRKNIPTAEYQAMMAEDDRNPIKVAYERRNLDLDPQLVWRGKDGQDRSDLVVQAPPLFIQEKVHPKVLIDDLLQRSKETGEAQANAQTDMFADFNGLPNADAQTEFYQHDANWSNRMILGDSVQVMASLAEREGLRGKVQCIYIDPPYGIKFNSNFQWSTTSNVVRDGKTEHITREPEQVKAFRDTWRDGVHSYMTYLRDRLTVARDLLAESGSIFVQIGDENIHRVRLLLDEVFGDDNFIANIQFRTKIPLGTTYLAGVADYLCWYGKSRPHTKYRKLFFPRAFGEGTQFNAVRGEDGIIRPMAKEEASGKREILNHEFACRGLDLVSAGRTEPCVFDAEFQGKVFRTSSKKSWKTNPIGFERCKKANRILGGSTSLSYLFCTTTILSKSSPICGATRKERQGKPMLFKLATKSSSAAF